MEDYIMNAIYAVVGISFLISWIVLLVQVIKIRKKLTDKDKIDDMIAEAEMCEMIGDNKQALRWLFKAIQLKWDSEIYFAQEYKQVGKLENDLKSKYLEAVERNNGKWPEKFTNK